MDDATVELSDLVSFYPERNDANLQAIISSKKEFRELASLKNERIPQIQGELFNHQKFFGRFMRFYDRGLVVDKPGTGKTCKVITAMEWFQLNRGIIKKFFVIVPNKAVMEDAKKQIICMCDTNDRYKLDNLIENKFRTLAGQKISASRGLARYYEIFTHGQFARYLIQEYPDEEQIWENQILVYTYEGEGQDKRRVFSPDSIAERVKKEFPQYKTKGPKGTTELTGRALDNFILNKVKENPGKYRLRLSEEEIRERAERNLKRLVEDLSGSFYYIDEGHLLAIPERNIKKDSLKQRVKQRYYNQFARLLHNIKRSKAVITTATPMINDPSDIGPIINLLREGNDPIPEDFNYGTDDIEYVNRYFGGYVSYVAPIDNNVDVRYMGQDISHVIPMEGGEFFSDMVRAVPLPMSAFQNHHYIRYLDGESGGAFRSNSLQASVFVFPDGSVGTKGLARFAVRPELEQTPGMSEERFREIKRTTVRKYEPSPEFLQYIARIEPDPGYPGHSIRELSTKCAEIIKYALNDREGVIYVNIPYVEGGAIPFALCFERVGFEIFTQRESVFTGADPKKIKPYCPPRKKSEITRSVKLDFPPRRRCAIFSSDKVFPGTVNEAALEIVSSRENVNGDYVKIIIITPVGKVGISVNNVSKVFTVTPDWNESNNIQKEYRAVRATSHTTRIDQIRNTLEHIRRSGGNVSVENLESIRINLEIYRLAAIPTISPGSAVLPPSADLDLYLMAKEKEIRIQKFFRKLMIIAVDCALNKKRNQMINYEDGSAECNYEACQYVCYGEPEQPGAVWATDYSTYDIYYLGEILEDIIDKLIPIVKTNGVIGYDKLFEDPSLRGIPQKHIIIALSELISSKRGIKDRFGFTVYLNEKDGVVFLNREYPQMGETDYSLYYYGKNLINIEFSDIDSSIANLEGQVSNVIAELKQYDITSPIFLDELNSKSLTVQASILEYSLEKWELAKNDELDNVIINRYTGKWFRVYEPVKEIDAEIAREAGKSNRGRPRTRKIKKYRVNRLTGEEELIEDINEEIVYFHILYIKKTCPTMHGQVARELKGEGRYRLYKPSEMRGWRDMDKYELIAYNIFIQTDRQQKEGEMQKSLIQADKQNIYGRISGDTLHIVDKTKEDPFANGRTTYRGKVCNTWSKHELVPVMYELGILLPPDYNQPLDINWAYQKVISDYDNMKLKIDINEISTWNPQKIDLYARWLLVADRPGHTYSKPKYYCPLIKQAMIEQGRIVEF